MGFLKVRERCYGQVVNPDELRTIDLNCILLSVGSGWTISKCGALSSARHHHPSPPRPTGWCYINAIYGTRRARSEDGP